MKSLRSFTRIAITTWSDVALQLLVDAVLICASAGVTITAGVALSCLFSERT